MPPLFEMNGGGIVLYKVHSTKIHRPEEENITISK